MTRALHHSWTAGRILEATQGVLLSGGPDQTFAGISIDSRSVSASDCFVAIKGDVHDGHAFIPQVLAKGVQGIILRQEHFANIQLPATSAPSVVCIGVPDTVAALGALAKDQRRRAAVSVAAITGSNGKTSTRTMAAAVIAKRFRVLVPERNFNNEIGLPLTLLKLKPSHEWAVLELGMNHAGEISRLADICEPDIGLITNIGPAHLEGLGSLEGVMHAKGELLAKVKTGGRIILNADDPMTEKLMQKTSIRPLLFGMSESAHVSAAAPSTGPHGISFTLRILKETAPVTLHVPGAFMGLNALAAAAIGHAAGISIQEIAAALADFRPIKGRLNLHRTDAGVTIIDDTYNANPASVKAAVTTLTAMAKPHAARVILGDMLELGGASSKLHREVGFFSARAGVARLYATGKFAGAVLEGAEDGGMAEEKIFSGTKNEILQELLRSVKPGEWLLVKGSRGMHMETLVQELMKAFGEGAS